VLASSLESQNAEIRHSATRCYDIDDPVALAEMATAGIALLPLRGADRRRLCSAAKDRQSLYPAVFVVPFAEGFPGEPDGVISGHGVLLPDGYHSTDRLLPSESRSVRVQVGPFSGYRTYFIAWFLLDADALARFDAKLTAGETLELQSEPGVMVKAWSGDGPPTPSG
jgi:hypothetical protein